MGNDSTELPPEVFEIFREEARENLAGISSALGRLEAELPVEQAEPLVRDVARRLHSIKGAASSLGFEVIGRVAHAAEALLLARPQRVAAADVLPGLIQAASWLGEAIAERAGDPAALLQQLGQLSAAFFQFVPFAFQPAGHIVERGRQLSHLIVGNYAGADT